jgi:hypothetical protein
VAIVCLDLVGATVMHAQGGVIFLSSSAAKAWFRVWAVLLMYLTLLGGQLALYNKTHQGR